jgi:hypothetical protein
MALGIVHGLLVADGTVALSVHWLQPTCSPGAAAAQAGWSSGSGGRAGAGEAAAGTWGRGVEIKTSSGASAAAQCVHRALRVPQTPAVHTPAVIAPAGFVHVQAVVIGTQSANVEGVLSVEPPPHLVINIAIPVTVTVTVTATVTDVLPVIMVIVVMGGVVP